jgi:hypothetical protein
MVDFDPWRSSPGSLAMLAAMRRRAPAFYLPIWEAAREQFV